MSLLDIAPKGFDGVAISIDETLGGSKSITRTLARDYPFLKTLSRIDLPDGIKAVYFGGMATWEAEEVTFPSEMHLGEQACAMMPNLRKATCRGPISLDSRGSQFWGCTNLEEIHLNMGANSDPRDYYQLPPAIFTGCSNLREVNLYAPAFHRIAPGTFKDVRSGVRVNVHTLTFKLTIAQGSTTNWVDLHIYTPIPGEIKIDFESPRDEDMYAITLHKEEL